MKTCIVSRDCDRHAEEEGRNQFFDIYLENKAEEFYGQILSGSCVEVGNVKYDFGDVLEKLSHRDELTDSFRHLLFGRKSTRMQGLKELTAALQKDLHDLCDELALKDSE